MVGKTNFCPWSIGNQGNGTGSGTYELRFYIGSGMPVVYH